MKKILIILGFVFGIGVAESFAANNSPIYTSTPSIQSGTLTGNIGLTRSDGVGTIGTDIFKVFQADNVDGSFVSKVRITAAATTSTSMTASVVRIYLSSKQSGATTAADTYLFQEQAVAALAAAHTSNSTNFYEVTLNLAIPAGWTILASIDDNLAANTRWFLMAFAGDY